MLRSGTEVTTKYGQGYVQDIRESDGVVVVELRSWNHSRNSAVMAYLQTSHVKPHAKPEIDDEVEVVGVSGGRVRDELTASLKRVFNDFHITECEQARLFGRYGISCFSDLCSKKDDFKRQSLRKIQPQTQKALAGVVDFVESRGLVSEDDPLEVFNLYDFLEYLRGIGASNLSADDCYAGLQKWIHQDGVAEKQLSKLAPTEELRLYKTVVDNTKLNFLSKELLEKKYCEQFLQEWVPAMVNAKTENLKKPFVVHGKTQSGKTAMKAIAAGLASELKAFTVVITRGVPESKELTQKLQALLRDAPLGDRSSRVDSISFVNGGSRKWSLRKIALVSLMSKSGIIVAADNQSQIRKVIEVIHALWEEERLEANGFRRKFVLITDEADAMFRTQDRSQRVEEAYLDLMDLGPILSLMVTATPVPLLLFHDDFNFQSIGTSHDYMGVDDMEPFKNGCGEIQFLPTGGLKHSQGYQYSGRKYIPYTNHQTMQMYEDAAKASINVKGKLLLDITCPRVNVDSNIFNKAKLVRKYIQHRGQNIAVVVSIGSGLFYCLPQDNVNVKLRTCDKGQKLSDLLTKIDEDAGLEVPVFVFGFSKMTRGVSCRSNLRVPTHLILAQGMGHSVDNMGQAMGRGTFIGKELFEDNMGKDAKVKILTTASDWSTVQAHQRFILEIQKKLDEGFTFKDAKEAAEAELPSYADFKSLTNRNIGQVKRGFLCKIYRAKFHFSEENEGEDHDPCPILMQARVELWNDLHAQRVMRVLLDLDAKDNKKRKRETNSNEAYGAGGVRAFDSVSIQEAYNDTYKNFDLCATITKTNLTKVLNKLYQVGSLVDRSCSQRSSDHSWLVKSQLRMKKLINLELAYDNVEGQNVE